MTSENKKSPISVIVKIILLLVIAGGVVLAVLFAFQGNTPEAFDWEKLNPKKLLEALKQEHIGNVDNAFAVGETQFIHSGIYMDNLLLLTESDIRSMNSRGEELWYHTHELRQPVLQVNGKMALLYEQNGKDYMVLRDGKVLLRATLESKISYGEITSSHLFLVAANDNGYKRTIYSVSPENGVQLGAMYIDDYYPYYTKTVTTEGSQFFLLLGLGMNSNHISTIIRLHKASLETSPITGIVLEGLYPVMFHAGGKLLFAGEWGAYCYDQSLELSWSKQFESELQAAGLFENASSVFAVENNLLFLNNKGVETKRIAVDAGTDAIEIFRNTAAVISGNEAAFYDAAGNSLGKASLPGLLLRVHFVDEKKAFIVSEHEAILHAVGSN